MDNNIQTQAVPVIVTVDTKAAESDEALQEIIRANGGNDSSSSSSSVGESIVKIACIASIVVIIFIHIFSMQTKWNSFPDIVYDTFDNIVRRAAQYAAASHQIQDPSMKLIFASRAVGMTECLVAFEPANRIDERLKGASAIQKETLEAEEIAAHNLSNAFQQQSHIFSGQMFGQMPPMQDPMIMDYPKHF